MALLTFPLSLATVFDRLPIVTSLFDIPASVDIAETGDGEILSADIGTALWSGSFDLDSMSPEEAADVMPFVNILKRSGSSFFVGDPMRLGPQLDRDGVVLGAAAPTILGIGGSMRELSLQGLPAGYGLRRGDLLSFSYLANPTRYALHECLEAATAAANGRTGMIEVTPPLRSGVTAGAAVVLVNTKLKARLVPAETTVGTGQNSLVTGGRITWRQTLR